MPQLREITEQMALVQTSAKISSQLSESLKKSDARAEETNLMQEQLSRYNLTSIDALTSAALSKAESDLIFCRSCQGFDHCQYSGSQKGFKPHISVVQTSDRREISLALSQCCYKRQRCTQGRNERLFKDSNLPKRYEGQLLENYSPLDSSNFDAYLGLSHLIEGLTDLKQAYLSGPSGSGKTALVSLAGNELIRRGRSVMYTTATEFLMHLRRDDYLSYLEALSRADMLILEDIPREATPYSSEHLLLVIDRRQREDQALILTGTSHVEDFLAGSDELGERFRNRLNRMLRLRLLAT